MRQGWRTKRLGDVCEIVKVKCMRPQMPYVGLEHIESHTARFIGAIDPQTVKSSTFGFSRDHVLYGRLRPYLNKVVAPDFEGHCSTEIFPIKPGSELSREYLLYWFLAGETVDRINATCTGARMPRADMNDVLEFEFPLPPFSEQQRIVTILDEAFDGIAVAKAKTEKNVENARDLFESYVQSIFSNRGKGCVEKPLGEVCDLLNGFAFKSTDAVPKSQTQLIRMGNLYGNRLSLDRSAVFYPDKFAVEFKKYLLNQGDLIMSLTGTTGKEDYGYAVRIPDCGHNLLLNQRIAKFDSIRQDLVIPNYLTYYLRSRVFLDMLYPTARGTRQANLSSVTIKALPIPLWPPRDQERTVSALDEMEGKSRRLESMYQQKLSALEALKKSLLHQAFSGAL